MTRVVLVCAAVASLALPSGVACAQVKAPLAAKGTDGRCQSDTPVCGSMGPDHRVPFANACEADEAGATRVVAGPCSDDE